MLLALGSLAWTTFDARALLAMRATNYMREKQLCVGVLSTGSQARREPTAHHDCLNLVLTACCLKPNKYTRAAGPHAAVTGAMPQTQKGIIQAVLGGLHICAIQEPL